MPKGVPSAFYGSSMQDCVFNATLTDVTSHHHMMNMRLLLLVSFSLVACAPEDSDEEVALGETQQAIINGTPTSNYESVGILRFDTGRVCTGFLISRNVVATAAHCLVGARPVTFYTGIGAATANTADIPYLPNLTPHSIRAYGSHPYYSAPGSNQSVTLKGRESSGLSSYDAAYVVLTEALPIQPLPFGGTAYGRCTIVGYGLNGGVVGTGTGGIRREGTAVISGTGIDIYTNAWPNLASNGDSGGPLICQGNAVGIFSVLYWNSSQSINANKYTATNGVVGNWLRAIVAAY